MGGRNLDYQVMEELSNQFKTEFTTEEDPKSLPKCRLRMLESIEKARKMLSADDQARILIENLLDDEELD